MGLVFYRRFASRLIQIRAMFAPLKSVVELPEAGDAYQCRTVGISNLLHVRCARLAMKLAATPAVGDASNARLLISARRKR